MSQSPLGMEGLELSWASQGWDARVCALLPFQPPFPALQGRKPSFECQLEEKAGAVLWGMKVAA